MLLTIPYPRKKKNVPVPLAKEVVGTLSARVMWAWHDAEQPGQLYRPYEASVSAAIEGAYVRGAPQHLFTMRGNAYALDFSSSAQVNTLTGTSRSVQRNGRPVAPLAAPSQRTGVPFSFDSDSLASGAEQAYATGTRMTHSSH